MLKQTLSYCKLMETQAQKTQQHLIIFGPTGSGKSTIANYLSNDENLQFSKNVQSGCYLPLQKNIFSISQDFTQSMTLLPQSCQIHENLTLWDIPGFGDNRSVEIDVNTTILSSSLLHYCEKSLIILLLPQKQFIQDKAQKLIEILNMINDQNIKIILVISKAEQKLTPKYIKEFLVKLIDIQRKNSNQSRLTNCSSYLLEQIINNDMIRIFRQPIENDQGLYEFCKENVKDLQELIMQETLYSKQQFKFHFSSKSSQYLEDEQKKIKINIDDLEQNLEKLFLQLEINKLKYQSDAIKERTLKLQNEYDRYNSDNLGNIIQYNDISALLSTQAYNQQVFQQKIEKLKSKILESNHNLNQQDLCISSFSYSSTQLMSLMENYIKQEISVKAIHINSFISFIIDRDIILPGISVYITTQQIIVTTQLSINLKGLNGQSHKKAELYNIEIVPPISLQGGPGQNGGSLSIQANQYHNVNLLQIDLSGGNGGEGQEGADGKIGMNGEDGDEKKVTDRDQNCYKQCQEIKTSLLQDLTTFNTRFHLTYISNGSEGQKGGDAREGGIGGQGGIEGILDINQQNEMKVLTCLSKAGNQGKNGLPGKGGLKGRDFLGIYQEIKMFGSFRKPDMPQEEEDKGCEVMAVGGVDKAVEHNAALATEQFINQVAMVATKTVQENVIQKVAIESVKVATEEATKEVAKKAIKEVGIKMAQRATNQILNRAGNEAAKQIVKKSTEQIGKQIGNEVSKQIGKQITKQVGTKITEQTAKETSKLAMKEVSLQLGQQVTMNGVKGAFESLGTSMLVTSLAQGCISAIDMMANDGIWIQKGFLNQQQHAVSGEIIKNTYEPNESILINQKQLQEELFQQGKIKQENFLNQEMIQIKDQLENGLHKLIFI